MPVLYTCYVNGFNIWMRTRRSLTEESRFGRLPEGGTFPIQLETSSFLSASILLSLPCSSEKQNDSQLQQQSAKEHLLNDVGIEQQNGCQKSLVWERSEWEQHSREKKYLAGACGMQGMEK